MAFRGRRIEFIASSFDFDPHTSVHPHQHRRNVYLDYIELNLCMRDDTSTVQMHHEAQHEQQHVTGYDMTRHGRTRMLSRNARRAQHNTDDTRMWYARRVASMSAPTCGSERVVRLRTAHSIDLRQHGTINESARRVTTHAHLIRRDMHVTASGNSFMNADIVATRIRLIAALLSYACHHTLLI